LINRLIN